MTATIGRYRLHVVVEHWRYYPRRPVRWGIKAGGGRVVTRCARWLWFVVNVDARP